MRGFALGTAIAFGMVCLTAQADQVEKTRPDDFAHAEWLAKGGHAWDRIAALVLSGTRTEGDVPGKLEKIIDLRTGYSRTVFETGPMRTMEGYDGVAWQAGNGIVNSVDLPPLVADARSEAFVDRAGWRSDAGQTSSRSEHKDQVDIVRYAPPGGSEVEVSYDHNGHLVKQVTVESDDGPLSITYSDWHSIGKVRLAFRQVQKDNTGEITVLEIKQARLLKKIDAGALARPKRTPHGQLTSSDQAKRAVRFNYVGGAHIIVPARINDVETNLIFDTGAANYFSPSSAQRFGLEVAGGLNLSGVGESSTTGGYAKARKISIGAAELKDEVVVVAPTPFGGRSGEQGTPDGFAGFEFLSEFRTTIVDALSISPRIPI